MIYSLAEGPINVPAIDIVSYSFDKHTDYDETKAILIDADDPSRSLSAASFRTLVRRLIAGFKAFGLQQGDCVLCQIPNTYFYPAIYFAIVGAGGVWCGSNPANHVFEVEHFVELSKPLFIVTSPQALPTILEICEKRQISKDNILVIDTDTFPLYIGGSSIFWGCSDNVKDVASSLTKSFTDLLYPGERDWRVMTDGEQLKNTPAVYF